MTLRRVLPRLATVLGLAFFLASCGGAATPPATATAVADRLAASAKDVDKAIAAMDGGDAAEAKKAFARFHDDEWASFEDGVKAKSPQHYEKIEAAIAEVKDSLVNATAVDKATALAALKKLRGAIDAAVPSLR